MFSVLFEVHPKSDRHDDYLGYAKLLRPELEKVDGFVDNVRYRSLTRPGWILSLSGWRDEKALVRWRTQAIHHGVQEKGRFEVFVDYHLRVAEVVGDTRPPDGVAIEVRRSDVTEVGGATVVTLIDRRGAPGAATDAMSLARSLGLRGDAAGLVGWDVFDAVLAPGEAILLLSWTDANAAAAFEAAAAVGGDARVRRVRVIRDYGMRDRREAPQYYPDVPA